MSNLSSFSSSKSLRLAKHRLALWWSYIKNRSLLRVRLIVLSLQSGKRPIVVISQVVHMGDIVACEPVTRYIRQANHNAFIVWALERRYRELADSNPEIDYTLPLECPTEWIRFAQSGLFDQVIDLNISGRSCPVCHIPWVPKDGTRNIDYDNYFDHGGLLTAYALSAGLPPLDTSPRVFVNKRVTKSIDRLRLPERFISIHCGANEPTKILPVQAWLEISRYIIGKYGVSIIELGLVSFLGKAGLSKYTNLCGALSILESAEVISRSILYIGTDSGPAHLANAVGAYGIIALGHYHVFKEYTPFSGDYGRGQNCELVRHDGPVAQIRLERILAAVDRRMAQLRGAA